MEPRKTAKRIRARRATTVDVIGTVAPRSRVPPKYQPHQRRLLELREAVLGRQADLAKDAAEEQPAFSMHMADAGTDSYDRDMALSILSSEQDALYQIDQALGRIRDGRFGICELTGGPIEPERLAAIPWTRFCARAEREVERDGALKRSRLLRREGVHPEREVPPEETE